MTFRVGDPVKCVNAKGDSSWAGDPLVAGEIYVVRSVGTNHLTGSSCIWLVGMRNRMRRHGILDEDAGYRASRFRPAVSPKQEVSFITGADPDSKQYDNRRRVDEPAWGASA